MSFDSFFAEWKEDNKKMIALAISEAIGLFLILEWIVINVPGEAERATIFLWLLIAAALVAGLDTLVERNPFWTYVDYGRTWKAMIIALVVGVVVAFVLSGGLKFSLLQPFAIAGTASTMTFLYTVIAAPFVEEKFFRGFLNPTSGNLFKLFGLPSPLTLGIIFSSIVFGVFHFIAYGGQPMLMFTAIAFGLIASVGNYYFKSRGFGVGLHVATNFIVIGGLAALGIMVTF